MDRNINGLYFNLYMEFSIRGMKQILRSHGNKRVSEAAAIQLGDVLEQEAQAIAKAAVTEADANDRVVVRSEDIRTALRSQ